MKTIREAFANLLPARRATVNYRWLSVLVLALGFGAAAAAAAPANDLFANAWVISSTSGTTNGNNVGATLEPPCELNNVNCDDDGPQYLTNSVWFAWTAPVSGPVEFDTMGSSFETVLSVWTGTTLCGLTLDIADNQNGQYNDPNGLDTSLVEFYAVGGTTYYISVDSWDDGTFTGAGGSGNYVLNWNSTPANDDFANAWVLTGLSGATNGNNLLATTESCETNPINTYNPDGTVEIPAVPVTNSVWFAWTAPTNGTVQFSTAGSAFVNVLSVWMDTNATPALCDAVMTNLTANDSSGNADNTAAEVSFTATVSNTYYISVASFNEVSYGAPMNGEGAYVLSWSLSNSALTNTSPPTLPTGPFSFTAKTYVVSQADSDAPLVYDGGTVNGSLRGARVTVTRPAPAYGRVLVDYTVGDTNEGLSYTDTFVTNYYGTNVLTMITSTDMPPILTVSNFYSTNILVTNFYQYYNNGYIVYDQTFAFTNSAYQTYNIGYLNTNTTLGTPLATVPTNFPFLVNSLTNFTGTGGGFLTNETIDVFGTIVKGRRTSGTNSTPDGLTVTNGVTVYYNAEVLYTNTPITNFFGTNLLTSFQTTTFPVSLFVTNYYYTNEIFGLIYSSNSIYTNGSAPVVSVDVVGTNWFTNSGVANSTVYTLNASNYVDSVTPLIPFLPTPTNVVPFLNATLPPIPIPTFDSSSNQYVTVTNFYGYSVSATQTLPSANGISQISGTLAMNNLQMSADILVPLSLAAGSDAPFGVDNVAGYAAVVLSNPRLDTNEDAAVLIPPAIANNTAYINALSPDFGGVIDPELINPPPLTFGVVNFERSTFRVDKNVGGGVATISVERVGGNPLDSVSVDYTIDPAYSGTASVTPFNIDNEDISGFYNPANTFTLQANSDYATPSTMANPDFIMTSGTLAWGAGDYTPKTISITITNNGLVEQNVDFMVQLQNPLPVPTATDPGMLLGQVNEATVTIPFDDTTVLGGVYPGQQPAGAVDRSWNKDNASDSTPPYLNYPGTSPGEGGTVYAVAEQPDGRAVIAGSFVSFDSTPYNRIVRVLANGYQDPTFQGNSSSLGNNSGANDFIAALALEPNGAILIGGNFTAYNGADRHYIARLNADGSLDTSFNPGSGANGTVWCMALESSGQIIIAGAFTLYNGTAVNGVARLNADGSLDATFNPGSGPDGLVNAVAVDGSQRVILGGAFAHVAGVSSGGVARLNVDGSVDTTFAVGLGTFNPDTYVTDPVNALAIQANGQILIGGSFANYNLVSYNGLARLNTDGTLDLNFQSGEGTLNAITGLADTVDTIALDAAGNLVIGGDFVSYNQTRRYGFARVFPDGSLDTSFLDTTYNQFAGLPNAYYNANYVSGAYPYYNTRNAVYAVALEANPLTTSTNILIGGRFEMVGGGSTRMDNHPRSNVARVIGGGTPGPGNIELLYNNYSVNNNDGTLYVSMVRTNGQLGSIFASVNVTTAAPGPGVAQAGTDFSPSTFNPTWVTTYSIGAVFDWWVEPGQYGPNYLETLNISPRNTAADVVLNVFNSGSLNGNLSAKFGVSAPGSTFELGGEYIPVGAALGAQSSAPLTIINDNIQAGVLGFSSPTYTVIEQNKNVATITVTRTNGSTGQVGISYATANGTGLNGLDYTGVTNTLTLGNGVTNATFNVVTLNNLIKQGPDKSVNLRLFTPSGGATLGLTNALLTLVNPYSSGHISFSQTNYTVAENAGNAVVTVNRLGGSATTLGVTLLTRNGSAFNNTNYLGIQTNLYWASGDATPRFINIPVLDDGMVTPNLVAYLQLTNSQVNGTNSSLPLDDGNAVSPTNATLTIDNVDSAGAFQFTAAAYSVKKYAGYALIPVTRVGGSIGTVTVNFTTMDGTTNQGVNPALQGVNYTLVTNTLTFTNGQVSQLLTVPIITTATPNGPRGLWVQLNTNGLVTQAALGTQRQSSLYIIDTATVTEPPGSDDTTYSPFAGLNGDVFALAVETNSDNQLLVGGSFTMADGVTRNNIARLNSDGSLDADFSLPSDNYGAGGTVRALAVQTDDRILVGGAFTNFNGVARGNVARLNADGTLDSSFNPGAGADNPVYAVAETFVNGNPLVLIAGAFATVNGTTFNGIGRLNDDGTPDGTFNAGGAGANATVYAMAVQADGKIVIGGDFTTYNNVANFNHLARLNPDGSVDTTFNMAVSGPSDSVRAIALQLDGRILIGGLFTNVNGTAASHIARLNANGTVDTSFNAGLGANDAVFSIALQADTRIVVGGEFTSFSGVTRNRITRLNPDGTVDPSINFGTGANNFVAAIAIEDDTISSYPTNVPDEKVILGGGFTRYNGATNNYLARIFGGSIGGSGAFQFSAPTYQVNEDGTNVLITVWRTGGTTNAPTGDVFITAYTANGTAFFNTNYLAVTTNLDFGLGEVVRSFIVPVMDDGVVTPNLTVNLALTNPTAPAQIGNQPTAVLTIINDDSTVNFSATTYSVPKNVVSGVAPITIVRNGGTESTSTVYFSTVGGSAIPGTDYTPTNTFVTFAPGVTNMVVDIPINNNGIPETNQTVIVQLADVTGSTLIQPTNAVLTIINTVNAPGQLSFAAPAYSITEGGGTGTTNVYVTITRTYGSSGTVSAWYQTQDGTAQAGTKYQPTNGVVSFADGETAKTIYVPVLNTATAEGPEYFSIYLYNPSGGATLVSPTNTVVTILNTNTGVAFGSAANAFTEPSGALDGTLLLNVVRFNNTNGTTTVSYSTTNGTATSGLNFIGVTNGLLTFNPGQSVQAIAITTVHDTNVTGDLFFTVGLSSPSAGSQLTTPSYTVVTDHDADAGISLFTNAASVYRNAGYLLVVVTNSNPAVEPFSVNYNTSDGSAVAGLDYTAESGTLWFTNGAVYNYFYVPILLNNAVQTNRQFYVNLSAPSAPGVLNGFTTQTNTIVGTNTPSGLSFATPVVVGGLWGGTNVNNTLGAPEAGDPSIAGFPANAPVWFQWTAPAGVSGEVTVDTIGSADTNGVKLDTVLEVYTGSNLGNLNEVAANDDLYPNYPETQINEMAQNIFNTNAVLSLAGYSYYNGTYQFIYVTNYGEYQGQLSAYQQPFAGPSGLRFNATGGTTYYIAADTKQSQNYIISNGVYVLVGGGRGNLALHWAYHPSGVFRFATESVDNTGIVQSNGNPMLLYQCAETEGSANGISSSGSGSGTINIGMHRVQGPLDVNQERSFIGTYYDYDVQGLQVTVTRVAGASGRMLVDYYTVDGNTNLITNGDVPASATNGDYMSVSNTLVFNDFEMSKTILIPIYDDGGTPRPNRDFTVVLANPRPDPAESGSVSPPRVDPIFGQVLCRILDCDIDPKGPTTVSTVLTNALGIVFTNVAVADQNGNLFEPTNALFNLAKANFQVARDTQGWFGGGTDTNYAIYVNRMGTNRSSVTLHYRLDNYFLDKVEIEDGDNYFPLTPGSDYATPTPPNAGAIRGTNSDFAGVGGDSGTLTFPGGNVNPFQSQPILINLQDNHLPEFNKDIHISIYQEDANGNPQQDGMVAEGNVTILFDDTAPPAGSVDELYNPDFAADLTLLTNNLSFSSTVPQPGADGDVYAVALATNGQAIIGGAFVDYTDGTNTYAVNGLARLNQDGSLDPTFNVGGSGVNVNPGLNFIRSVALTSAGQIMIGGDFTSFNGTSRNGVARLNADGTLDRTFKPGAGANGQVWSVLVQPWDGKVLIGGEFTSYNGTAANYVARLNTDGSLDSTFNASNILSGPVYAMALPAGTPFGFTNSDNGTIAENDQTLNLGLVTAGTLAVTLNSQGGNNDLQIYYGNTNVAAGTGVLVFDSGAFVGAGSFSVPFGPSGGLTTNILTVVMNVGGAVAYYPWTYTLSLPGQTALLVGGSFSVAGQSFANLARLNTDGSMDASFTPGTGPDNSVLSLACQPDGKILVGGAFQNYSGSAYSRLARLNNNGSIDPGFYIGIGADNSVYSINLQPISGQIYVGGPFTEINGTHRLGFARLNADGTVDTSFLDSSYNQFAGLPRLLYGDAPGVVYSSAVQTDGNIIIGGSFLEVGGGQADYLDRYILEAGRGLQPSTYDPNLLVVDSGTKYENLQPKTRDGVRNHSNVARLIGGATPGPGNIGMVNSSYSVNRSQLVEPVNLTRYNGSLGYESANFSVLPQLAKSGTDYSYSGVPPIYPTAWEYSGPTRMHIDGLFGPDGLMLDSYGQLFKYGVSGPASILVTIMSDSSVAGNLSANLQLANPSQQDQFYLGGQDIPVGQALGISQAPLTLIYDTHQDGVFGFSSSYYLGSNTVVAVGIVRTNGTSGTVQLNYQTTTNGSSAIAGADYFATNGLLTFSANQTSGSFPVTILNNSSVSAQEKDLNVQLFNIQDLSGGTAQLGVTNAVIRIINPNYPGYLTFTTNPYVANLSAGVLTFTVERTVGSQGTLTVQYGTSDNAGSSPLYAHNGTNYVGSTNTLVWNNGDVSPRTVAIPLINDESVGVWYYKNFKVSLFNVTNNGVAVNNGSLFGPITNATLQIHNDNSAGTFQFSAANYQYNENGGTAVVTVTRSGSVLGTTAVTCGTTDGTALNGVNYVGATNVLTFTSGQAAQSFPIKLLNDGKTNPPPSAFYFNVALSAFPAGTYPGSPINAQVHIVDAQTYNQPPGSLDPTFDPTAGLNASVLSLALQSTGQIVAGGAFTVANGTSINRVARFNTDGTLDSSFMNGLSGPDGTVNVVLDQTDDRVVLGGSFLNVDGVGRQYIARLMTDGTLDTSFNSGSGADNAVFALSETFINGVRGIYVGGAFATFNGTSSPGLVRLNNSGLVDASFSVGYGAIGSVYAVAAYPTNSVANAGQVLAGGLFTNFNGTVVGNLVRLNGNGTLDTNFNQNVSVGNAVRAIAIQLDGKVLIGGDFTNVNNTVANHLARLNPDGTLDTAFTTAAAPGINGSVDTISLQQDNNIVVGGQFLSANGVTRGNITRLQSSGAVDPTINFGTGANSAVNAAVIQPADGKIVIGGAFTAYDGQPRDYIARIYGGSVTGSGAFQFSSANYQVDENAGSASISIERTGGTSGTNANGLGDVQVAFATISGGTAVPGTNYTYTTNYLDFPVGEVLKTVTVPVQDDGVVTPNLIVNMALSNPTPGTTLGNQPTAELTIINDDSTVEFASSTYAVAKNTPTGFANITIQRVGSTSGSCSVNFATTTNGTAVAGLDYTPTNALVSFNPGDTNEIIQVAVTNNEIYEGGTTVGMTLTNASNTMLASPSNAVLSIQETVNSVGNLSFDTTSLTTNSSSGYATLSVIRTGGDSGSISVECATLSLAGLVTNAAFSPQDYTSTTNTLQFADKATSATFAVPVANNLQAKGPVVFEVYLFNPSGSGTNVPGLIAPTNVLVTIVNTNAAVQFALATNTVPESAGHLNVVIQRINNTNIVSSVHYATVDGTAFAGINYSNTSGTLVFGLGQTFAAVTVPLINQSNTVSTQFGMNLSNPTNAVLIAPSNTVVVLQGSAVGISFTTNLTAVAKSAQFVAIPVVCSNTNAEPTNTLAPLTVSYGTVDGTAKAGINYGAKSGVLTFSPGTVTNYIYIALTNAGPFGNLTFNVVLTNATDNGYITPIGTNAVLLTESGSGVSFSQAAYTVPENAGVATINVYRVGYTDSVVAVNYAVSNGTAIGGQNFYPTNGTLVFTNGVTAQAFNVQIIDNSQSQPNVVALMELNTNNLAGDAGVEVINPGTATLTILDVNGSYVVPAGAQLLNNSSALDGSLGVIGSNDVVKVLFAFRDAAGQNVTNLVAYLLATNGVSSPNPAYQGYGKLAVYGHSVSQPFSFTAKGTNSYTISPTFNLYDGTNGAYLGLATFTFTLGPWTTAFANTNMIVINPNLTNGTLGAAASPYPSIIEVTNLGTMLVNAAVTLTNLTDQSIYDLGVLVVSPTTNTLLMGHVSAQGTIVKNITLTFDDRATNSLPVGVSTAPVTSTNKPTQKYPMVNFP